MGGKKVIGRVGCEMKGELLPVLALESLCRHGKGGKHPQIFHIVHSPPLSAPVLLTPRFFLPGSVDLAHGLGPAREDKPTKPP